MLQERSNQVNSNKINQQNKKTLEYQIIENKNNSKKTQPFKQNSNRQTQSKMKTQNENIEIIPKSPPKQSTKTNQKQNQQKFSSQTSSTTNSSQVSQTQSQHTSQQSSQANSRHQSPIINRKKSPNFSGFSNNQTTKSSICNKNNILICILFILSLVCIGGFVYTDTERFCDYNNGQEGVNGCRKCPQFSENCSLYFFDCNPYLYQKYDGYCVPLEYFEEFRDLRDDLHVYKTISLNNFIENKGSQVLRNTDKVLQAIQLSNDVILDNDNITLIEYQRNFSLIYLALGLLASIIVFTFVNFTN